MAGPSGAKPKTKAELTKLAQRAPNKIEVTSNKKVHGLDGIKGAKATFIVAGHRDTVLDTLWDVDAFPEIFPDIEGMDVKKKEPRRIVVHFAIDAVVTKAEYTLDRKLNRKAGTIRWNELPGGDVKHIRGSWSVSETGVEGFTRVVYASYVDVGYYVPTGAVRDVAIKKIDEMAERVRKAVRKRAQREAKAAKAQPVAAPAAP